VQSAPSHVVQLGLFVDPQRREPARLLDDWPTLVEVAEAAQRAGVRVSVVQAARGAQVLTRNGVRYQFFAARPRPSRRAEAGVCALIRDLKPDLLHIHGLEFPHDVIRLAQGLPAVPVLLQDHASRPPRLWHRRACRRALACAAGVAFCAREQSVPFEHAGLISARTRIFAIPESTSRFTPGPQAEARARTRLTGKPCLLWVGHLNANKDPLTVLEGVSAAVPRLPGLELWCCYGAAPLQAAMMRRIEGDPRLTSRVHLLGARPHHEIEQLMRAADVYVAGSHREGSGYALIEALACGLPPVVTDIPSFRALTEGGAVGRLWRCEDARALAESLVSISTELGPRLRAATRAHFERALSLESLGRRLAQVYACLIDRGAERPR
jgi:glycosyltransferase involved in cell wall biosynthesis